MSGEVKKIMISCPEGLLQKTEESLIEAVRKESGFKLTRSKLVQVLFELTIDAERYIQPSNIYDQNSLKEEIRSAIKKGRK